MAVTINIINDSDKFKEVVDLKKLLLNTFCNELIDYDGKIDIYHNLTLFSGSPRHDIDLLFIGDLENYTIDVDEHKDVRIQKFCTAVEVKSHDIRGIHWNDPKGGNGFSVERINKDGSSYLENVTDQNNEQKDKSLRPYFQKVGIISPYVTNLIWFSGATNEEIGATAHMDFHNAVGSNASFREFAVRIARQQALAPQNGFVNCWGKRPTSYTDSMFNIFGKTYHGKTLNTLKTMNLFSKENGQAIYDDSFKDGKLTIFKGRAGTGKTISLLQLATYLCGEKQKKCLFLTYNKALVSDIKRMLLFAPFLWKNQIEILSVQKYFKDVALSNNLWMDTGNFGTDYNSCLKSLQNKETRQIECVKYDYVFIDEAQDWLQNEKEILLKMFSYDQIVVADGVDQFIRSLGGIGWDNGKAIQQEKKMSLRQKSHLVDFVNAYSAAFNIGWSVEVNSDLSGGHIYIRKDYNSTIHSQLIQLAKEVDSTEYDFLFLVPPQMVKENKFIKLKEYEERNIHLFDGTNDELRDKGYDDPYLKQCRLYQYDSCRGLEGWTTICLRFDELIQYKLNSGLNKDQAYLWSLMPLTRAIDTIVITLRDVDSEVGQVLRRMANVHPEYIKWQID